jgi:hypothetical protein
VLIPFEVIIAGNIEAGISNDGKPFEYSADPPPPLGPNPTPIARLLFFQTAKAEGKAGTVTSPI